jgi:hypothetical protein
MTLKSVAPADLPKTTRASKSKFTPKQIADAIEQLKAGQAIVPSDTYKDEGAARRAGLSLRKAILAAEPTFENDLEPSTRVYKEGERFKCAVLLRPKKS